MYQVGILTISTRASQGIYEDKSGRLLAEIITDRTEWIINQQSIVADDFEQIVETLVTWSDMGLDLILTSGGTGLSPGDITPEATLEVIDRLAPGLVEAIRAESLKITKHAMLSRAVAGMRGRTLIINMPGSPKAARENMEVILPVLPHALSLLSGDKGAEQDHRSV